MRRRPRACCCTKASTQPSAFSRQRKLAAFAFESSPVAKKTHFAPKDRLTAEIDLCLTSLNRGWLIAVAWKYVPKIQGRETEVPHEVQLVCSPCSVPSRSEERRVGKEC